MTLTKILQDIDSNSYTLAQLKEIIAQTSITAADAATRILGTVYLIDACLLSVTLSPWHASHEL